MIHPLYLCEHCGVPLPSQDPCGVCSDCRSRIAHEATAEKEHQFLDTDVPGGFQPLPRQARVREGMSGERACDG